MGERQHRFEVDENVDALLTVIANEKEIDQSEVIRRALNLYIHIHRVFSVGTEEEIKKRKLAILEGKTTRIIDFK